MAVVSAAVVVTVGSLARTVSAQEGIFANMERGVEFRVSDVTTTTTFASGLTTRTKTRNLFPTVTLTLDSLLYPTLRVNAGGIFELNSTSGEVDGAPVDSSLLRSRPFFLLRSTNPMFSPGFGYFRREDRARSNNVSNLTLINDEYAGYLGWNPADGPRTDFQLVKTNTFDSSRELQDVSRRFGTVVSTYTFGNLAASYSGTHIATENRIEGLDTRQTSHAARVSASQDLLRKRLLWNGTYNVNYQSIATAGSVEGAEIAVPINVFEGLAAISDLPGSARLTSSPQLVDQNLTASAGLDLGLPAAGEDAQARNLGIDFLNRAEVDRILVWVDRELPADVARSFVWEIYSSTDNIAWQRETSVSDAPFGPFENRFEILFAPLVTRYLKVVTRPLSVTVTDATRFPDVFVTEMQAFDRRVAGEVGQQPAHTLHLVNTDVRFRVLDTPSVFYEGFYFYNGPDAFGESTSTVSNGVSANHTFARIWSAYGRVARERGHEPRGQRDATVTSATLTVQPVATLRSSLLYTGQNERIAGAPYERRGVFVQNTAQIYRGINLLVGGGWNYTNRETGEISRDRLLNASGTIVPRDHLSVTFSYDATTTDRSGVFNGSARTRAQRLYGAVAVDPIRTLHLVLGEEVIIVTDQQTRTTHDVAVNWSPFPDGTLQIVFDHNEAMRALVFGRERSTLAAIRWNLSRRSFLDVSYQRTQSEFSFQKTAARIFSISLRLFA